MPFRRVLLVKPYGKKGLGFASDVIPIGLEYIAAVIEDVVDDINIVDMELEQQPFEFFIDLFKPDLVGITMSATDHKEGLRLAEIAKEKGCATVLGGYHPTAIPDELLSHSWIDMVVRGEGEYTVKELVQKDSSRDILGLSYKADGEIVHNADRPHIKDLDALPFPARHLRRHKYRDHMELDKRRERDVITISRGCWGRCSFCCEPSINKGIQRFRSPENVMNELLEISSFHKGSPLNITVTDPNFIGSPKRIERLCDLLSQHKLDIRFSVLTRVDGIVRNPKLVKKMCENGILSYEMGIESPKAEDLKNTQKGITLEMQRKAVEILRSNGALAGGTFVIGLPNQTEEEIMQFPLYAKELDLSAVAFGIVTPFPGTGLYEELKKDGLIVERDWTKYDEMHSIFKLKNLTRERLEELEIYCHAKFWTLDTLVKNAKSSLKPEEKIPLEDFIKGIQNMLRFSLDAATDLQAENALWHIRVGAEAGVDPRVKEYTEKVGLHNVIDFPTLLLKVWGQQRIQLTVTDEDDPIASYIIHTTGSSLKYVEAIRGRRKDATINLDFDLRELDFSGSNSTRGLMKKSAQMMLSPCGVVEMWNRLRMLAGLGLGLTQLTLSKKFKT